jgi:hypothetical protein
VNIASQLAEGEDDLYIVANNLVSWIKENIEYSLDTITEKASQPASWVVRSRYGVCDEITSLFIAMARSLGIPARFVSGVAYTNWNELNDWGPHAWAEVYYPGTGWVSYDITYNEFGYVDATHIALKVSLDSNESSTEFGWAGVNIKNVELIPKEVDINVELLGKTGKIQPDISLAAGQYKSEIGFGSYDVVEAEISNLMDYYVSEDISVGKVAEIEIIGRSDQQIVLKPGETKKIFWLIKLKDGLDKRFIYTIPVLIYSSRNITAKSSIESKGKDRVYSIAEMQQYIDEMKEEEQKKYSRDITLSCAAPEKVLLGEKFKINCDVSNEGNVFIRGLKVCLDEICEAADIGISKSANASYELSADAVGEKDYTIKASNADVSKTVHVISIVYDEPNVEIKELSYREKLKFGEELELKFILGKISFSNPLKTKINIINGNAVNSWDYGELKEEQDFVISFDTKQMKKENKIQIQAEYYDEKGGRYVTEKEILVEVEADRLFDKLKLWMNGILGIFS